MSDFEPSVVKAVVAHMNDDQLEYNLIIVRANGAPEATAAAIKDVDAEAGTWEVVGPEGPVGELRIPWPDGPISERADIRRAVVTLYDAACAALGVEPGPH